MGASEERIEAFAADLRQLRRDVGQPSFRDLEVHARQAGTPLPLPASTASDAVRGRRLPKAGVVIAFVLACRHYAEMNGVPVPNRDLETYSWQEAWAEAAAALDEAKGTQPQERERHGPDPHSKPSHQRFRWWIPERLRCSYLLIGSSTAGGHARLAGVHRACEQMSAAVRRAVPWMSLTVMLDPTNQEAHQEVDRLLAAPLELLVVHVVGHGFLNESAHLSLIMRDSQEAYLLQTSLDLHALLDQAGQLSRERAVILVVDTSFAGAAIPSTLTRMEHWFVLAATEAQGHAYEWNEGSGSFTGVLARLLSDGITSCPYPLMTVRDLAREAQEAVLRELPAGRQIVTWNGTASVEGLAFAYNQPTRDAR